MLIWPIVLAFMNLGTLIAGLSIGEFEYSKYIRPYAGWFSTPRVLDSTIAVIVSLLAIISLALLYFIFSRKLTQHIAKVAALTVIQAMILGGLWLYLGSRFLSILWPTWR